MTPHPVSLQANPTAAFVFMAVGAGFFALSLFWAIKESTRLKTSLPFLALIGGAIASLEEAWIDILIQLWYPSNCPLIMFTAMGVHQPFYVHLIYPGFIGLGAYVPYRGLLSNPDGRLIWRTFFGIVTMDFLFEA